MLNAHGGKSSRSLEVSYSSVNVHNKHFIEQLLENVG